MKRQIIICHIVRNVKIAQKRIAVIAYRAIGVLEMTTDKKVWTEKEIIENAFLNTRIFSISSTDKDRIHFMDNDIYIEFIPLSTHKEILKKLRDRLKTVFRHQHRFINNEIDLEFDAILNSDESKLSTPLDATHLQGKEEE